MTLRTAPCDWPLAHCGDAESPGGECSALANLDEVTADIIREAAVSYLWTWTRRKYGTCPVTIRPCRKQCLGDVTTYRGHGWQGTHLPYFGTGPLAPALLGGEWFNLGCGGGCGTDPCECGYVPEVDLPGPVHEVTEVRIDGAVLASTAWRVDNNRYLIRTDGGDWPACQDMTADPETDPDTFSVTYSIGTEVPAGGQLAAGVLACEMAKAACGSGGCRLPQRLQSITRQGVTTAVLDGFDSLYAQGSTGLWLVDSWVASENAAYRRGGGRVMSPDVRGVRRTTSS